jgi:regulator of nonsense transcripts 1
MTNADGQEFEGHAAGAQGRTMDVRFNGAAFKGELHAVRVVGREEARAAEKARDVLVLRLLLGHAQLAQSAFIRYLWFPVPEDQQVLLRRDGYAEGGEGSADLNASQRHVLNMMTCVRPLVIVQGMSAIFKNSMLTATGAERRV